MSNLLWVGGFNRGKTDEDDGVSCWGGWTRGNFCKGVERRGVVSLLSYGTVTCLSVCKAMIRACTGLESGGN